MKRLLHLLLSAAVAAPLTAQTEAARQDVPFTWHDRITSGAWLRVYNSSGDVDAMAADGPEAEVRGERGPGTGVRAQDELSYVVLRDGNDVILCVLAEYQTCDADGISGSSRSRRGHHDTPWVSVTIKVPRGVKLAASSGNGEVHITGVTAEVEARSGNGDLSVEGAGDRVDASSGNGDVRVTTARGPVNATTGNGQVWVRMESLTAAAPMDFHSGNGTVTVMLPDNFEGDIEASTGNGEVESDFPITTQGRFSTHRLAGRIGRGGPTLQLRTGNGDIELRRLVGGR